MALSPAGDRIEQFPLNESLAHFSAVERARHMLQDLGKDEFKACLVSLGDAAAAHWVVGHSESSRVVGAKLREMYHSLPESSFVEIATQLAEVGPALPEIVRTGIRIVLGWQFQPVQGIDWREETERLLRMPREEQTANPRWDEAAAMAKALHRLMPVLEVCKDINSEVVRP